MPLQIVADALEPKRRAGADEPAHVIFLPVAELHHEPAAGLDPLDCRVHNAADIAQAVGYHQTTRLRARAARRAESAILSPSRT